MCDNWKQSYAELKEFTASNSNIEITPTSMVIPSDVRPEFYRLFNNVREEFIKDNFQKCLDDSYELSRCWIEASQALIEKMGLTQVKLDNDIGIFLRDPMSSLIRVMFDPLFDLLKDKLELISFENTARQVVSSEYEKLFAEGYRRWITVSFINLLDGDNLYDVPVLDFWPNPTILIGINVGGIREDSVPGPVITDKLVFEVSDMHPLLTPNIITHSKKLDCFVAFRTDYFRPLRRARLASKNREWLNIDEIVRHFGQSDLWPSLGIYVSHNLDDLLLIADYYRVARPDLLIDIEEKEDWYAAKGLDPLIRHYNMQLPIMGALLLSRYPVQEAALKEIQLCLPLQAATPAQGNDARSPGATKISDKPEIHLVSCGFNPSSLETAVEILAVASGNV